VGVSLCWSLIARALQASDVLASVAAAIICICYAGLLAASLVLARRDAGRDRLPAFLVEAGALLAMVLLLVAMLCNPDAWRQSVMAVAACGVCMLCAVYANARGARVKNGRAAHSRLALSTNQE